MQSNPPPVYQQNYRLVPQVSSGSYFPELALQDCSSIGQQAPTSIPQFSNYCYFGQLKPQAGYVGPEIGYHNPPPYHHDMRVITEREIEKLRIREEIIKLDIARRHAIEAEVRRELIMERESVPQRGSNGFPFSSLRAILFEALTRLPHSVTRVEERLFLVDMIAKLFEESLNGMRETGRFDSLLFQRGTASSKISEVLLPKAGSKRQAEKLDDFTKKKARVEWSCAVCKFNAYTKRQLNEHLLGRKHKNEESKMRRARKGSNCRIGLLSKKATKCKAAANTSAFGEAQVGILKKNHLPSLQISLRSHSLNKRESKLNSNIQLGEKPVKKRRRARKRSKKRASRLLVVGQNCEAGRRMISGNDQRAPCNREV